MTLTPSADLAETGVIAGSADAVLDVRGVSKHFRTGGRNVEALDRVSLRLRSGRVMGQIGPDGAGKTTLMRLCAGLLLPDAGEITAVGRNVLRDPLGVQSDIGYMPQRFGLYEDLTVQENLDLYADLQGVPNDRRSARYAELMKMTGLAPFAKRLAGNLSGGDEGMKQKPRPVLCVGPPRPTMRIETDRERRTPDGNARGLAGTTHWKHRAGGSLVRRPARLAVGLRPSESRLRDGLRHLPGQQVDRRTGGVRFSRPASSTRPLRLSRAKVGKCRARQSVGSQHLSLGFPQCSTRRSSPWFAWYQPKARNAAAVSR